MVIQRVEGSLVLVESIAHLEEDANIHKMIFRMNHTTLRSSYISMHTEQIIGQLLTWFLVVVLVKFSIQLVMLILIPTTNGKC